MDARNQFCILILSIFQVSVGQRGSQPKWQWVRPAKNGKFDFLLLNSDICLVRDINPASTGRYGVVSPATTCHYLSIFVSNCRYLSFPVITCHYLSPLVTTCHYLSLFVIILAIFCPYLSLPVTTCHYLSSSVTTFHYYQLTAGYQCCVHNLPFAQNTLRYPLLNV